MSARTTGTACAAWLGVLLLSATIALGALGAAQVHRAAVADDHVVERLRRVASPREATEVACAALSAARPLVLLVLGQPKRRQPRLTPHS